MADQLTTVVAVVFAVFAAISAWAFSRRLGAVGEGGRAKAALIVLAGLLVVWTAAASLVELPFFGLHLTLWLGCALIFCIASGKASRGLLAANLVTSCVGVSEIFVFAIVGIAGGGGTLWQVNASDLLRPLALAVGLVVFSALAWGFCRLLAHYPLVERGGRPSRALYGFSWFSLVYILFDTLPSLSRLDLPLLSFFLAASMVLLAVSLVAFVVATSLLGHDARQQEEYLALVERRDQQEARLKELRDQAYSDALTGLKSRRAGVEAIKKFLAEDRPFSVTYLDMNGLKKINDTFGHEMGDTCLVQLASALVSAFPPPATVCRMSGDEFLIVFEGKRAAEIDQTARMALEELQSCALEGVGAVSFSWGVVEVPSGAKETAADLVGRADLAMYAHKRAFYGEEGALI